MNNPILKHDVWRNPAVGRGLVREVGPSPQDPKRRYFLSS